MLQAITEAFEKQLPEIEAKFNAGSEYFNTPKEEEYINQIFAACPNISIDYGIMEKADNVYVLCADFDWSDLGTWGALYDLSDKDEHANVTLKCQTAFYESQNNIVALPQGKLAVINDLDGYIVAEADNVLLICKKENEHAIRQYVNDAQVKFNGKYN